MLTDLFFHLERHSTGLKAPTCLALHSSYLRKAGCENQQHWSPTPSRSHQLAKSNEAQSASHQRLRGQWKLSLSPSIPLSCPRPLTETEERKVLRWLSRKFKAGLLTAKVESGQEKVPESQLHPHWTGNSWTHSTSDNSAGKSICRAGGRRF